MHRVKREIMLHRSLYDGIFTSRKPTDAAAPGNTVMDDSELCTRRRRFLEKGDGSVHAERNRLYFIPFTGNLESVIRNIVKRGTIKCARKPRGDAFEFHKSYGAMKSGDIVTVLFSAPLK